MRDHPLHSKSSWSRWRLLWQRLTDRDTPARKNRIAFLAKDLKSHVGDSCRIIPNFFERTIYSKDLARVPPLLEKALFRTTPLLVVQPEKEQDVSRILSFCQSRGLTVFPRGTGSFAFGGAVPTRNGIVMDLSPMMSVLDIDPQGLSIRVQPGARWADVATKLVPFGLVPTTTPTSRFSTVGGWIATGGMGLDSYAYGHISESVLKARIARPDGTIQELRPCDESFDDLFGTEGQLGILTEATLRVRPRPRYSGACLREFEAPEQAFAFVEKLANSDDRPSHVVFFDREYMRQENCLFRSHTDKTESIVPERETVLLQFENPDDEQKFLTSMNGDAGRTKECSLAARYLWAERYFPLKAQRISPGLLGTEVVIPRINIPRYIRKVRRLARYFDIKPTIEVIVCRRGDHYSHLVILSFNCDYSRKLHYVLCLLLIQLLVRTAVQCGGHPYGVGIWNTPFLKSKITKDRLAELIREKKAIDPKGIMNPHKFFKLRGRFFGIPDFFMRPAPFRAILAGSHFLSPLLGLAARLLGPKRPEGWEVPEKNKDKGESLLHQSAQRCTYCGSCISVCPAYHITKNELVTGRAKLRMGEAMMRGEELMQEEACAPFQCLHCGLCEEVCQTRLPLRDCYLVLEDWIAGKFGFPGEIVQEFVGELDSSRDYIRNVFGLDLPEWTPEDRLSHVPAANRISEGEET